MLQVNFTLDIPPSVNHCYANNAFGKGYKNRRLTDKATTWKQKAAFVAREAARKQEWSMPPPGQKVVLELVAYWPDGRRRDMNNTHKLLCDALEHIIYEDDKCVLVRDMNYTKDKENPRLEVVVYPLEGD